MQVQAYLYFNGRCEEAIEFYRRALDAEVSMMLRFSDSPEPPPPDSMPAGSEGKIMHASFRIGDTEVTASDGFCSGAPAFDGFALSLMVTEAKEADARFAALADGGEVRMPLTETFFSPRFGMVVDRFGVLWNIVTEMPES